MPTNYGNTVVFRTVRDYLNEKFGAIKTFKTLVEDTVNVSFYLQDSLYNDLGVDTIVEELSTDDFKLGEHHDTLAIADRIQLPITWALEFDGTNYVETSFTPTEDNIGVSGECTLEATLYFEDYDRDQLIGAFGRLHPDNPDGDPTEDSLYSRLYFGRYRDGAFRIGFGDQWRNLYDVTLPTEEKVHLAMTNDGTTTRGYVEGEYIGSIDSSFYFDNINAFHIGRCNGAYPEGDADEHRPLFGQVDEVRIWKTCRTEQEINDNKDKKIDINNPDLLHYWRLDEGTGDVARCSIDENFNGTLKYDPDWVEGFINYDLLDGYRISVPEYIGTNSSDLKIYWEEGIINRAGVDDPEDYVTIKVEIAVTDTVDEEIDESDWIEQTNNTSLTGIPNDTFGKYLWIRISFSNTDNEVVPYISSMIIFDNEDSPYGFAYIEFDGVFKVTDKNGECTFNNIFTSETSYTYTIYPISINDDYIFSYGNVTKETTVLESKHIEHFIEVNSYRTTHLYRETAVIPDEFPVRFTQLYQEIATILYTYIPGYPPFDWYPCFYSTSCWDSWTIEEYENALEDQVLQFYPPSASNKHYGLFWLGRDAENCILKVVAKVDRVKTSHTEDGEPPPEAEPYSPQVAYREQPDDSSWENNIFEDTEYTEDDTVQLVSGETSGFTLCPPLEITTGYDEEKEYEGESPPKVVGSSLITWDSDEPEGTEIEVYTALRLEGEDGTEVEDDEWQYVENGESIPDVEAGDFFENIYLIVKVVFRSDDSEITPVLNSLTIDIKEPEQSGEYDPPNGQKYFGIFARGSGLSDGETDCYLLCCTITNDGHRRRQLELGRYTNGSWFQLDAMYYEWDIDTFYNLKISAFTDTIQGKIWKKGESEPSAYQLSARDSSQRGSGKETLEKGFSGVYCRNADDTDGLPYYYFDSFHYTPTKPEKILSDVLTVEVVSTRDGYESWQAQTHTFECWGYGMYYGERYGD